MTPHSIENTLIRQGLAVRKVHRLRYANFFKQPIHLLEYTNQLIITCFDLVFCVTVSFDRSLCFKSTWQNISTSIQKHPIKLLFKKHEDHDFSLIWTKNLIAKIPRYATPILPHLLTINMKRNIHTQVGSPLYGPSIKANIGI